jgi:hypothetical protein
MADDEESMTLAVAPHLLPADASVESEIERLRAELAGERERRIVAEAVAEERARALDDARLALRALAGPEIANAENLESEVPPDDGPPPRPRGNWLR